jgi:hypothetical protein
MKTLSITLALMATLVSSSYAMEYVTLHPSARSIAVEKGDVIEIVAVGDVNSYGVAIKWSLDGGATAYLTAQIGSQYSGMRQVETDSNEDFVTLKVTKANEINAVAPTSLLVIPENSTGNYNIVVETSSDTSTWTPFHSQTVSAADAKRFFRTRIVKAQ